MSDKSNNKITKPVVVSVEKAQRPGERPVAPAAQKPPATDKTPRSDKK